MTQTDRVLFYSYDFHPGTDFEVAAQLETSTTVRMLQTIDEETVPEISQTDEYTGNLVRYTVGEARAPAFLFTRGRSLSAGDSGTVGTVGSMFSFQLNLMETAIV